MTLCENLLQSCRQLAQQQDAGSGQRDMFRVQLALSSGFACVSAPRRFMIKYAPCFTCQLHYLHANWQTEAKWAISSSSVAFVMCSVYVVLYSPMYSTQQLAVLTGCSHESAQDQHRGMQLDVHVSQCLYCLLATVINC